jgi:hypothetical protein
MDTGIQGFALMENNPEINSYRVLMNYVITGPKNR